MEKTRRKPILLSELKADVRAKAIKEFAKELMADLDGDIKAYANAGHSLNIYEWLTNYLKSKGTIETENMMPKEMTE